MSEKEELRLLMAEKMQEHLKLRPDAVVRYAAQPAPDRNPWRKRPSLLDKAFSAEIEKAEKEQSSPVKSKKWSGGVLMKKNMAKSIVAQPLFRCRQEKPLKGKGSFRRGVNGAKMASSECQEWSFSGRRAW
jgi:stalled ribosome alternative rescue factor ArfA